MVICPDSSEVHPGIVAAARREAPDLEVEITTYDDPRRTFIRLSDGATRTEPYDDDEVEITTFTDPHRICVRLSDSATGTEPLADSPDAGID